MALITTRWGVSYWPISRESCLSCGLRYASPSMFFEIVYESSIDTPWDMRFSTFNWNELYQLLPRLWVPMVTPLNCGYCTMRLRRCMVDCAPREVLLDSTPSK